jgi:hypothetical protein
MLLLWFSLHVYEEDEEAIENVSDETLWTVTDGFEMPSTGCELVSHIISLLKVCE